MSPFVMHQGRCHCGGVRIEVDAPPDIEALECNCSICRMTGFLHVIVPASRFRLVAGAELLAGYTFNTGVAQHFFCRVCGVKPFYVPRSHPDGFDVNVRCLEPGTIASVRVTPFDDNDREAALTAIADLTREPMSGVP